jgi:Zn-dependent protease
MAKLLMWLFAAGKLGKLSLTAGTMLLSIAVYSMLFGWRYAVGFVLLIFVHEMGHFLAARQRGLDVGAPTFIPFVGAWIQLKEMPHDAEVEAYVGVAGPLAGTLGALGCLWAANEYGSELLLALAYSGFMINLFNLIPISPMDGGRITAVISPKIWFVGIPMLVALFLWRPSPMLILIGILAYPQIRAALSGNAGMREGYYDVPLDTRIAYGVLYLALAGFLAVMSYDVHQLLERSHPSSW